jgi:flagellar basal body-associated protein FliL
VTAFDRCPSNVQGGYVSILWIILIVVLVLALLGFFTRGAW